MKRKEKGKGKGKGEKKSERKGPPPSVPRPFLDRHPEARYWIEKGLKPSAAKALGKAGYRTLADLAGKFREDLISIRGFGETSLEHCEALLGSAIPSRIEGLEGHGLHPQVVRSLDRAGIHSLADLGKLTREQFLATSGFGEIGLRQCERALGRPLDSPVENLRSEGLRPYAVSQLAARGVRSLKELAGRFESDLKTLGMKPEDIQHINRRSGKK